MEKTGRIQGEIKKEKETREGSRGDKKGERNQGGFKGRNQGGFKGRFTNHGEHSKGEPREDSMDKELFMR